MLVGRANDYILTNERFVVNRDRFATKIAGKHVDMDTRGDGFVNIDELLE